MHIGHIKITHIQILVYCKKCSYPIDYGLINYVLHDIHLVQF